MATAAISGDILPFSEIGAADLPRVGGKGANLGVLTAAGFPVPTGFCVTTDAYARFIAGCAGLDARMHALDALDGMDVAAARTEATATRALLEVCPVPEDIEISLVKAWRDAGAEHAYAVRSSATAEDLPGASFAGQQDTYLNVRGQAQIVDAVKRCWISLFTDRAVLYRARNRFGHREVALSVVVQRMVSPEASGILFTADPVSGHRGVLSIDAGFGLGEALVSGLVTADLYKVDRQTGALRELKIGDKAIAILALPEGGTVQEALPEARRKARVLNDAQIRELSALGVAIEAHYGGVPQDVEWCLEQGRFTVVQARPITSLSPLPPPAADPYLHLYLHFGHVQMMTDPISPMGRDLFRLFLPFGRSLDGDGLPSSDVLVDVGHRLYIDTTPALRVPAVGRRVLGALDIVYGPAAAALREGMKRPEFKEGLGLARPGAMVRAALGLLSKVARHLPAVLLWRDTESRAAWGRARIEQLTEALTGSWASVPEGGARVRAALRGLADFFLGMAPNFVPYVGSAILAQSRLEAMLKGEVDPEDLAALGRALDGNLATEMDLLVGDLADLVRPFRPLAEHLRSRPAAEALATVGTLPGGAEFLAAWASFMAQYGDRAVGEIDVARPRWRDDPTLIMSAVLGNLSRAVEPGEHRRHFARQRELALAAAERVKSGLGPIRRRIVDRLIRVNRAGLAMREHPKFAVVRCLGAWRRLALEEGARLVAAGRMGAPDDVFMLQLSELLAAADSTTGDLRPLVAERRAELALDANRKPPLTMTSQGEILTVKADLSKLPPGAMLGTPASAGVVEGLARVITDPSQQVLNAGEILVAPFTDPGWTPLFVHAAGLVTEVGGLMTHGSVVAREYGIPAVVSVDNATTRIRSGMRLRVDGSTGIVMILDGPAQA